MLTSFRYNGIWTRDVQNAILAILLCGWLGGMPMNGKPAESGKLFTIEEVGEILGGKSSLLLHSIRCLNYLHCSRLRCVF